VSLRTILVVAMALICGASAAVGVTRYRGSGPGGTDAVSVVMAAKDVARGQTVTAQDVTIRQWPREMAPSGALIRLEDAVDRAAAVALVAGEPVLNTKLAPREAGRGLAALIPSGMRAYTIQTSRVAASVTGFMLPGNKVDVLLNLKAPKDDPGAEGNTATLLESVEILAVDQRLDASTDNKANVRDMISVTLLVTPEQAGLLNRGQNQGQLTLSLRNPEDKARTAARPATLEDLRFHQEKLVDLVPPGEIVNAKPVKQAAAEEEIEKCNIITLRGNYRGMMQVTKGH
jgi:pilus assembly protein CpaB